MPILTTVKDLVQDDIAHSPDGSEVALPIKKWNDLIETLRHYENMSGERFTAPSLGNATPSFLVDELGEIKADIKPKSTYEKVLIDLLKRQKPESNQIEGEKYTANFNFIQKQVFDSDKFKSWISHEVVFPEGYLPAYNDFTKTSSYWEVRVTKNDEGKE